MSPSLTFIALSDRPRQLAVLLSALQAQTRPSWECLVLDQSDSDDVESLCARVSFDDWLKPGTNPCRIEHRRVPRVGDWGQTEKMRAVEAATTEWVAFPNDDAYYCPSFVELMLAAAAPVDAGLVYCDWVSAGDAGRPYQFYAGMPVTGHIDVGGFIVKREAMLRHGWPNRGATGDGLLVESLVRSGVRTAKVHSILYVKN